MSNVSQLMNEYFEEPSRSTTVFGLLVEDSLPVKPDKFVWQVLKEPERFFRRFEFSDRRRLIDFVDEVLDFEDNLGHHGKLTINHQTIDIEVNTKTVETITNLDQEYVKGVDEIYHDVEHYRYKDDRR